MRNCIMGKRLGLLAAVLAGAGVLGGPAAGQLEVDWRDGDLGGSIDFVLRAPAGTLYLDILSLTEGPTCFPPKHPVGCIDVDLQLLWLSFQIPGFFGTMGGSGELVVTESVPNDPVIDGIVLNQQMVSIVSGKLTEKSNLCKVVFGFTDTWEHSLSSMGNDALGVAPAELADGRVLIAGGGGANLDQCELYEPCLQQFSVAAALSAGRAGHTVTRLEDGTVLVVGGADVNGSVLATAELYDPAADTWTPVGPLSTPRVGHTASLLADGRVLVAGGTTDASDVVTAALSAVKTTELFDPATLAFGAGPDLARPHVAHAAVTLASGDVVVGGGATWFTVFGIPIPDLTNKAQMFQVSSGSWSSEVSMKAARVGASSILLGDGRALFAGGIGGSVTSPAALDTSEILDPATGRFTSSGTMSVGRSLMTMLKLPATDLILVAGGATGTDLTNPAPTDAAELFDPATGLFSAVASLPEPRAGAGGLVQPNRHAILFGGAGAATPAAIYRD